MMRVTRASWCTLASTIVGRVRGKRRPMFAAGDRCASSRWTASRSSAAAGYFRVAFASGSRHDPGRSRFLPERCRVGVLTGWTGRGDFPLGPTGHESLVPTRRERLSGATHQACFGDGCGQRPVCPFARVGPQDLRSSHGRNKAGTKSVLSWCSGSRERLEVFKSSETQLHQLFSRPENAFLTPYTATRRLEDPESFTNTRIQKTSLRSSLVLPITARQTLRSILVLLSKSHNFAALMRLLE